MKLIAFLLLFTFNLQSFAEDNVKVLSVKGLVSYDGEYIKKGQTLSTGKVLDASGKSYVVIEYPGGRKLQLKSARAKINSMGSKESEIELLAGKLFGWFKPSIKKKKATRPFRIQTRGVVAGVRGTKFMIEELSKKTYLCVCEGEVAINKGDQQVALKKGFDLWDKVGQSSLKEPAYAQTAMLDRVAESVSEMGGTTQKYWMEEGWKGQK
ncbi:MAG: FecR family protein [Pseudomonadota bacterium]